MTSREELHLLVQKLPENDLPVVRRFLEYLCGVSDQAVERALRDAPLDDEPFTAEDVAAVDGAIRQLQEGGPVSWEQVVFNLGRLARR
jgi:hypothetical protein